MSIVFGTDGWRAIMADGFTFDRVRLVARAIAAYLHWEGRAALEVYEVHPEASYPSPYRPASAGVVVGHDTRFQSPRFAAAVAEELARAGIPVWLADTHAPTPALSLAVRDLQAAAAVVVTASHNPPEYNGIKLKPEYASSGLPEVMEALASFVATLEAGEAVAPPVCEIAPIQRFSPWDGFAAEMARLVDLPRLRAAGLEVVIDPMHGAGQGLMERLLRGGETRVQEIRSSVQPTFDGCNPEPIERNLAPLAARLREVAGGDGGHSACGIALDGDADRVGAMDAAGRFYTSHEIFAIMLWHLVERRGWRGGVVKTFSTSRMIENLARHFGLPLHETPIGFKYIVEHMLRGDVLIGGEESGGIGVRDHIPERDGILSGLLLLEAMAWEGDSLPGLLARVQQHAGTFAYDRADLHLASRAQLDAFLAGLREAPPTAWGGVPVQQVLRTDGIKYALADEAWILFRPSGTEPVLRVYVEASTPAMVAAILGDGQARARAVV